jgi:TP901 family phage tail tape measure protein
MSNDANIGISIIMKVIDQGSQVITQIGTALDKIGLSAQQAGAKSSQAGQQMEGAFKGAAQQAEQTAKSVTNVANSLASMGASLAAFGTAVLAPLGLATRTAADFEHEMNKVKALMDFGPDTAAAAKDFDALTEKARQLGRDLPQFTAAQAAGGMQELARAGYQAAQITASIPAVLNLAFTENRNMAETAQDLVGILNSFQLGADQASRAADVLAKTSNATTTSMAGLAEGLKYAGPVANALGISLEETSAWLGVFSNNNIKAEMAGTRLRRIMELLSKPTSEARATLAGLGVEVAKQADGNVDLITTFERLHAAGMTATDAFSLFGMHAATVGIVAARSTGEIRKLTQENTDAGGSLQKMVDIINSGLLPAWKNFISAASDLAIQFAGPFLAGLKLAMDGLTGFVRWIVEVGKAHPILSQVIVGVVGFFGALVAAAGVLALTLAGVMFAWDKMRLGWQAVLGISGRILSFFGQSISSLGKETVVLNENTAALARNAQARAQGQRAGQQAVTGYKMGGASGAPIPVGKGAGVGIAGAAMGIGAGLLESQMDLGPTANAVSKVGELGGMLAAFGPVAGTIIVGISSWVKVLTKDVWDLLDVWGLWTNKPKAPDAFTARVDATLKQMDSEISMGRTFVNNVETAIGRAVSDFGGSINQYADEWKKQFGEELPLAIRAGFAKAQEELKNNGAAGFDNAFAQAAKSFNTISGKLDAMKNTLEVLDKATTTFYATMKQADEIKLGNAVNEITAMYSSEKLAATQIADVQAQASARNILNVQHEYDERKAMRDQMLTAAQAAIEKELSLTDDKAKREEILKGRADLEKSYRDQSIEAEKGLRDSIAAQIKKESDAVKTALEERRKLEQDIRTEQQDAQRINHDVAQKSMNDMDRLRDNYAQAADNLKAANALLPTMPEKAMELAKKARDEFKGLAQDIDALRKDLDSTFKENQEMLRDLAKQGMTPTAAWVSDLDHVKAMIQEAQDAMAKGDFTKAAELAGKAKQPALGLAKNPEGSGFSDQQIRDTANMWLQAAIEIQEAAKKGGIAYAQEVNKGVGEGIGKAGIIVKTAQESLLDENTKQLRIHGELLKALTGQYNAIIAQNNKLIEAQGGKGVEAPDVADLANAVKEGAATGTAAALSTQSSNGQGMGVVPTSGPVAGSIPGVPLSDLSPELNLLPEVRRQREEAQKLVQLERGQKLNSAFEAFPELAGIVSPEDFENARNVRAGEEDQRQSRMDALKALEARAGAIDVSERRGYDVSSAERSFSALIAKFNENFGATLEGVKNVSYRGDTSPNVTDAARTAELQERSSGQMLNAVSLFEDAVKAIQKTFGERIQISVNVDKGLGAITRY